MGKNQLVGMKHDAGTIILSLMKLVRMEIEIAMMDVVTIVERRTLDGLHQRLI